MNKIEEMLLIQPRQMIMFRILRKNNIGTVFAPDIAWIRINGQRQDYS